MTFATDSGRCRCFLRYIVAHPHVCVADEVTGFIAGCRLLEQRVRYLQAEHRKLKAKEVQP